MRPYMRWAVSWFAVYTMRLRHGAVGAADSSACCRVTSLSTDAESYVSLVRMPTNSKSRPPWRQGLLLRSVRPDSSSMSPTRRDVDEVASSIKGFYALCRRGRRLD